MSSSDETTVETESPLVIKRPVPRKQSASESEENDSEPERTADESEEEGDDATAEDDETEKSPQPVVPVAPKPSSVPKAPRNAVKSKTYDRMVHEAMETLNEIRRLGVSIQRIVKYVNENYDVASNKVKFYCKKAIDKGLKENIYVHTSGVGLAGSIAFSVEYWNDMKKAQNKILKAAEREEKSKATTKRKPKPKPKPKEKVEPKPTAAKKPKATKADSNSQKSQPQDKNNNPTVGKAAAKKTKKIIRLSVNLPTTRAKPKPKAAPGAKTIKDKPSAKTTGKAVPSAKGRQQSAVTTRSKSVDYV